MGTIMVLGLGATGEDDGVVDETGGGLEAREVDKAE